MSLCIWVTQAGQKQRYQVSPPPPEAARVQVWGLSSHQLPSPGTLTLDQVSQGQWRQQEGPFQLPKALARWWLQSHPDKALNHLLGLLPLHFTSCSPRDWSPSLLISGGPDSHPVIPFLRVGLRILLTHSQCSGFCRAGLQPVHSRPGLRRLPQTLRERISQAPRLACCLQLPARPDWMVLMAKAKPSKGLALSGTSQQSSFLI